MCKLTRVVLVVLLGGQFGSHSSIAQVRFGDPVNLGPAINTVGHENTAELSPNGLELIFTSTRAGGLGGSDFWVSTRDSIDNAWGPASHLGSILNSSALELSPELSADGLTLYFDSGRPGSQGQDLWMSSRDSLDLPWRTPTNLGPNLNKPRVDIVPSVTADELSLIFTDGDPFFFKIPPAREGLGGVDLWISTRPSKDDPWGPAVNFGSPVNSTFDEGAADISQDGLMLVFTADRPGGQGGPDLWMSTRDSLIAPWEDPFNLGPQVNHSGIDWVPRFSPDGAAIFFGSYRSGGYGGEDIWRVDIIPEVFLDCSGNGLVDAEDLQCVSAETIGETLTTLSLVPGDFDASGQVTFADFLVLSSHFGREVDAYTAGDIDLNGTVEFADFLVLSANFGSSSDPSSLAAVPEPASLMLLAVAMVYGLRRRA